MLTNQVKALKWIWLIRLPNSHCNLQTACANSCIIQMRPGLETPGQGASGKMPRSLMAEFLLHWLVFICRMLIPKWSLICCVLSSQGQKWHLASLVFSSSFLNMASCTTNSRKHAGWLGWPGFSAIFAIWKTRVIFFCVFLCVDHVRSRKPKAQTMGKSVRRAQGEWSPRCLCRWPVSSRSYSNSLLTMCSPLNPTVPVTHKVNSSPFV